MGWRAVVPEALTLSYGSFNITSDAGVEVTVAGDPKKIGSVTAAGVLNNFTHSNGRLTYSGSDTKTFCIAASLDCSVSGAGRLISTWIAIDGAEVDATRIDRDIANAGDEGALALFHMAQLSTGQYVEIFADGDGTTTATFDHGNLMLWQCQP